MMKAQPLDSAFERINANEVDVAIVMENDLYRHSSVNAVDSALAKLEAPHCGGSSTYCHYG